MATTTTQLASAPCASIQHTSPPRATATRENRPTRYPGLLAALACVVALAMTVSTAGAAADSSHKFRVLAPGLQWSNHTMTWHYAPEGQPAWAQTAQMVTLTQQAMNMWSSQCGVRFGFLGTTQSQATVQDGASIIGWLPMMTSGANTSWYMRDGALVESDIQLNVGANGSPAAAFPLLLHELGHAIGLDHSEVRTAVMAGPPAAPAYSYATTLQPDDIAGCQALYGPPDGAPPTQQIAAAPSAATPDATALEYYHAGLDHYFMSANPIEQAALAKGGPDGGWRATGMRFPVWKVAYPGLQPMCRFYGDGRVDPATGKRIGPDSHFYTANPSECDLVSQRWPVWVFEGDAFYAALPDASGACPGGTQPVYRYFRPQGDPNHRYVTTDAGRREMATRGWTPEGVTWCSGA